MIRKKRIFCMIFLLLVFLCGLKGAWAETMNQIVAIVNGDIVTEEEVDLFIRMGGAEEAFGDLKMSPEELRKKLLDRMIEDRLILQEAKRLGIKPDEKVVDDRIRDIKTRAGSAEAFEQALKSQGLNLTELKEKLRNQYLIISVVQKEVKSKVTVSPKEVTDYFQQHSDQFQTTESVVVDSIFVEDKESLNAVLAAFKEGKNFDEVAGAFSKKSSLGSVARGQLKKELEDVIFSLNVGERSAPVSVEGGFTIFLAKEKLAPSQHQIDEVKDKISWEIESAKTERLLKEWIESLKDKAYISIR